MASPRHPTRARFSGNYGRRQTRVVSRCDGGTPTPSWLPAIARALVQPPSDDSGQPHTYYGRLWLIETDGSPGAPLTEYPAEPPDVVDFGYHDAWPTDDEIFLQWRGDCGGAAVANLNADGTGDLLDIEEPDPRLAHGVEMIDIHDGQVTIYGWDDCAATVGGLFTVDLDGRYLNTLVPVLGDSRGVIAVSGLATVHP